MLDRPAGRVTCVVPAFKGENHHGAGRFGVVVLLGVVWSTRVLGFVDGLTHLTSLRPWRSRLFSMSDRLSSPLLDALHTRVLVADGAMGTALQAHELSLDDFAGLEGCNEILNI